jgi:hypothetical protein
MQILKPTIEGPTTISGSLEVSGSLTINQNLNVVGEFQGAATTASYVSLPNVDGFTDVSSSIEQRISSQEAFSSSLDATFATDADLNLVSSSVDSLNAATASYALEANISGAFTSVSASFASERLKNTTDTLDGDLTVTGKITAQEFHTEFVSASIIYESGSTKFGDSSDDVHEFFGSLIVSGSISVPGFGLVSGSSQVLAGTTIHSGSFFNGITVVSGSSQISHDSTTGYVSNQHIDHTTVSISPGSGLSGGGTIAATRTLTLDTGSVHFLDGVKKELNTDGVISGSLQITALGYATTGSNAFKNNQIVTGSLTVTGNGEFGGQAFSIIHNQGTVSTTTNIDWDLSNVRTITLGASVITLTFSNPKPGATYTLIIKQDGTGNRTIGWPTIRWPGGTPPTLTSVLNSVDVVTLIYDGSVYYGAYINDLK